MFSNVRLRLRLGAALAAIALASLGLPSTAAARVYTPPYADVGCSVFLNSDGSTGFDSRPDCAAAFSRLSASGYQAFNSSYINASAMMGTGAAQSDAIWAIFGHGGPGGINMTIDGHHWTTVFSDPSHGSCSAPNGCLSSYYSNGYLRRLRFMLFAGCETSAGSQELQTYAKRDGVDSSIGFSTNILADSHITVWTDSFFYWSATYGLNVFDAAIRAETDVYNTPGFGHDYGGMNNSVVWGPSIYLKPAAYGTY